MARGLQRVAMALLALVCIGWRAAWGAVPSSWQEALTVRQHVMPVMARVYSGGTALQAPGSRLAAFKDGELRGVAEYTDGDDGGYFNLPVGVDDTGETGFTFQVYSSADDGVHELALAEGGTSVAFGEQGYGGFTAAGAFAPMQLSVQEQNAAPHANYPNWKESCDTYTAYNMTFAAQVVRADGSQASAADSLLGIFDGEACVGYGELVETPFGYSVYEGFVYSNASSLSKLAMKFYDGSSDSISAVWETMEFVADDQRGSQLEPLELHSGIRTVSWSLKTGWNWVAMNVTPSDASVGAVLADYQASSGDQVKTSNASSTYYKTDKFTGWSPSITLNPGVMYMVRRQGGDSATVDVSGAPCQADATLSVKAGWNWLGLFNGDESCALTSLASTGGFANTDQIKGQTTSSTYYVSSKYTGWSGQLTQLVAGQGYKLKVAVGGTLSIEGSRGGGVESSDTAATRGGSCPWTRDENVSNTMTFCVTVTNPDGTAHEDPDTVVGVFETNGTCIGLATYTDSPFGVVYEGMAGRNSASTVSGLPIKVWRGDTQSETTIQGTSCTFEDNAQWGNQFEPVELAMTASTYAVTVSGGTASPVAAYAGQTVTITANAPAAGKVFSKWTTTSGVTFANAASSTTTFTMPAKAVGVTATYENAPTYAVTVSGGTASPAAAYAGQTVTITANAPATGKVFSKWTTNSGVTFANATSSTTTFTMPAKAVGVTATYENAPTYAVTVSGGTASPAAAYAGQTVTITANAPATGKVFSKWTTTSGVTFANAASSTTTFTMPAKAVGVTATYENAPTVAVNVTGGWADKASAQQGETVTVHADFIASTGELKPFKRFAGWSAVGVELSDASSPVAVFEMPESGVSLSAEYEALQAAPSEAWQVSASSSASMTVIGKVKLPSGTYITDGDSLVGCFDGDGVCRGVGGVYEALGAGKGYAAFYLQVNGAEDGEELSLALWSHLTDEQLAITQTLVVEAGGCSGSGESPIEWTTLYNLNDAGNPESPYYSPEIFGEDPDGTVFSVVLSAAWEGSVIGYDFKLRLNDNASVKHDGYDRAMPPRMPSFASQEYAHFTSEDGVSLMVDSRPEEGRTAVWTMTVVVPEDKPAVVAWDADDIPEGWEGEVELFAASGTRAEVRNLLSTEAMDIREGGTWKLVFTFTNAATGERQVCSLKSGWNLMTPTLELDEASVQALMAYKPMAMDGTGMSYVAVEADDVKPGVALWIWCDASEELTLTGTAATGWTFAPKAGWSFVGAVEDVPADQWPETVTDVWCWTAAGFRLVADTLKAGTAYWIFTAEK